MAQPDGSFTAAADTKVLEPDICCSSRQHGEDPPPLPPVAAKAKAKAKPQRAAQLDEPANQSVPDVVGGLATALSNTPVVSQVERFVGLLPTPEQDGALQGACDTSSGFGVPGLRTPQPLPLTYARGAPQMAPQSEPLLKRKSWLLAAPPRKDDDDGDDDGNDDDNKQDEEASETDSQASSSGLKGAHWGSHTVKKAAAKETREQAQAATNTKKQKGDSKCWGSDGEPDADNAEGFNKDMIGALIRAITRDMHNKLSMAPGGELTPESLAFVQQTAKEVIERQCELLQDSTDQVHKGIIADIAAEVDRLNRKLASNYDFRTFSQDLADLMDQAVDVLNLQEEHAASCFKLKAKVSE